MTTPLRHYLNFALDLSTADGSYLACVLDSPTGQADVTFALPFGEDELCDGLRLVG